MKNYQLIAFLFILNSCLDKDIEPTDQFQLFNRSLIFEYYYFNEEEWPTHVLRLKLIEKKFNNKLYYAFYDDESNPTPSFVLHDKDGELDFNFLPVRYENGNYYEYRGGDKEVLILKDKIKTGDSWKETFDENEDLITYTFEVVAIFSTFYEFGIEYKDVYKIKETFETNNTEKNRSPSSYHYYNKENGLIRREIPTYQSGTYGPITFNRVQ